MSRVQTLLLYGVSLVLLGWSVGDLAAQSLSPRYYPQVGSGSIQYYLSSGSSVGRSVTTGPTAARYSPPRVIQSRNDMRGVMSYHHYRSGSWSGRSVDGGSATYYYNSGGSLVGRSLKNGPVTTYYDAFGMPAGRVSGSGAVHIYSKGVYAGRGPRNY